MRTDPKELGRYFALAQVGLEMVVPIGIGYALDEYLGWRPWGVTVGAFLGFAGGLLHLLALLKKHDEAASSEARRDPP
jgi:F0F1-type ATP synthase assembly protein I